MSYKYTYNSKFYVAENKSFFSGSSWIKSIFEKYYAYYIFNIPLPYKFKEKYAFSISSC